MHGLDAPDRAVLVLHYLQGLSYGEMAAVLDEPVGTVKWRTSEALNRLRALFCDKVPDHVPGKIIRTRTDRLNRWRRGCEPCPGSRSPPTWRPGCWRPSRLDGRSHRGARAAGPWRSPSRRPLACDRLRLAATPRREPGSGSRHGPAHRSGQYPTSRRVRPHRRLARGPERPGWTRPIDVLLAALADVDPHGECDSPRPARLRERNRSRDTVPLNPL